MEPEANLHCPVESPVAARPRRNPKVPRQKSPLLDTKVRITTCQEVALGFTEDQARMEVFRSPKFLMMSPVYSCALRA
jgi:hypothetical protein